MTNIEICTKIKVCNYEELSFDEKKVINEAKKSSAGAYAPYSKFQVGAAVLLQNGEIVCGSNQENIAYPSGLCAERTALFAAGACHPDTPVVALAVAAQSNGAFTRKSIAPCGSCRQVIVETERRFGHPVRVLLYGEEAVHIIESGKELLPFGFDAF